MTISENLSKLLGIKPKWVNTSIGYYSNGSNFLFNTKKELLEAYKEDRRLLKQLFEQEVFDYTTKEVYPDFENNPANFVKLLECLYNSDTLQKEVIEWCIDELESNPNPLFKKACQSEQFENMPFGRF